MSLPHSEENIGPIDHTKQIRSVMAKKCLYPSVTSASDHFFFFK